MSTYVLSELKGTQLEVFKVGRHRFVSTQTSFAIERKHGGTLLEVSPGQLTVNSHNFFWGVRPPLSANPGDIVWNTASSSNVLCWQWDGEEWQEYQRAIAASDDSTDFLFTEEGDNWVASSQLLVPAAQVVVSPERQFVTEQQLSLIAGFTPETKASLLKKIGKATRTNSGYLTSNDYTKFITAYETSQELASNQESVSIPTELSDFNNDVGFITTKDLPDNVSAFTNDAEYVTTAELADALASLPEPDTIAITHLSQLINDAGYLTQEDLDALSIASLSDVRFTQYPANKDVLSFDLQSQKWGARPLPVPSLEDLKDVTTLGKRDKNYLGYNRSNRRWEPMTFPSSTTGVSSELVLQILSGAELDDLSDVTISNLTPGDVLTYKDGAWRNITPEAPAITLSSLQDVEIGANLEQYTLLVYKDSSWQTVPLSDLPNVSSGPASNLSGLEISNVKEGHILRYDGNNNKWRNVPLPAAVTVDLGTLPSVRLQTPFKTGQALIYDADNHVWRNQEVSQFTVEGLSNTVIIEPKLDDVLAYQPSTRTWINKKIQPVVTSSSTQKLNDLEDVVIAQNSEMSSGYVLSFDAIGNRWISSNPNDIFSSALDLSGLTTDMLPEGEVNYYFTQARFLESLENFIGRYGLDLFFTPEYLENATYGYIPIYTNPGWTLGPPSALQLRTTDLFDVKDSVTPVRGDILNFDGSLWQPANIRDLYSPVLNGPPEYISFTATAAYDSYGLIYWCGTAGYSKPYETPTGAAAPFDVVSNFTYIYDNLFPVEDYIVPLPAEAYNAIDRDPLTTFTLAGVSPKFYIDLGTEKRIKLIAVHFAGSLVGSTAGVTFKVWGIAPEYPNGDGDVTLDTLAYINPDTTPAADSYWSLIDDVYVLSIDVDKAYRYIGIEGVAADYSEDFITLNLDYFELYGYAVLPSNQAFSELIYESHSNYVVVDYSSSIGGSNTGSSGGTPLLSDNQTLPGGSENNGGSSPVSGRSCYVVVDVKTSNYTANACDIIPCDTSAGSFTITTPATGKFRVIDVIGTDAGTGFGLNNLTISPSGTNTIMGGDNFILDRGAISPEFQLIGTDWRVSNHG